MANSIFSGKNGIIIPLILAALGVFLIFQFLTKKETELGLSAELIPVLVASSDIPAFTKIDSAMVKYVDIPRKFVQPSALGNTSQITRRVTLIPLLKGEQILSTMLSDKGQSAGLALKIRKGFRAVSVGIDAISGVSGLIRPGDKVDVIGTFDLDKGEGLEKKTYTILQNINVLAVGQDLGAESKVEAAFDADSAADMNKRVSGLRRTATRKHEKKETITLLVDPDQVQKIVLTQSVGELSLALCPVIDDEKGTKVESLNGKDMLGIEEVLYMPKPWREIHGDQAN